MLDTHLLQIANNPALHLNDTGYIDTKYQYELIVESSDRAVLSKASGSVKRIPDPNRTSGTIPYLFVDNADYTFGYSAAGNTAKAAKRHEAYLARIKQQPFADNEDVQAVVGFLSKSIEEQEAILGVKYESLAPDFKLSTLYIAVKNVSGEALAEKYYSSIIPIREDGEIITDMTSGESGPAMITARKTIAGLSHCSNCFPSGDRWGRSGADQIGMTEKTNVLLSKAFSYLLSSGHNSFKLHPDYVFIFFEDDILNTDVCDLIKDMASIVVKTKEAKSDTDEDDEDEDEDEDNDDSSTVETYVPDECELFAAKVHSIYNARLIGNPTGKTRKIHMYICKCGQGTFRWSVVSYSVLSADEIVANIDRFFSAQNVPKIYKGDRTAYSIFSLLKSATRPKTDFPKKLVAECINSIILGRPFPEKILRNLVARFTKGKSPTHRQMTLLNVIQSAIKQEIIPSMLDHTETNISYNLGRVFAAISVAQMITRDKTTELDIGTSRYSSACTTPAYFPMLISTFNKAYLGKLLRTHRVTAYNLIMDAYNESIARITGTLPKVLNMDDQIQFARGYTSQRTELTKAIFTKNTDDGSKS